MTARDEILQRIRQRLPEAVELPDLHQAWTRYENPVAQFAQVLAGVGGRCIEAADVAAVNADLAALPAWTAAARRCSYVADVGDTNFDLAAVTDPRQLADVDFAVLPGQLAVAENGAVWVETDDLLQRTLYFLAQHVALVVPAQQLVHHLHEGYQRIRPGAHSFATWMSGPSKTADIEQSLVIGAHGARSLTVYLLQH